VLFFSRELGQQERQHVGRLGRRFVDGRPAAPLPLTGNVHNFGGQNFDVILANGNQINLYWSDPLGGSSNDYDLFILNAAGTAVLASSTNIQNGTQDPFEVTGTGVNLRIVVLKRPGQPRVLSTRTAAG
jgi:hypothetical protein